MAALRAWVALLEDVKLQADWPTLCFLGLGPASADLFLALTRILPELQVVLIDVEEVRWIGLAAKICCDAVQWSLDTPAFSFYRYRELFYSSQFVLGMLNMQGCYPPFVLNGMPSDRYYCEYLYSNYKGTVCGKLDENNFWNVNGQELYFPTIDAGCGEHICLCHGHSDTFVDSNLEHLCRKGEEPSFMGQWGQDRFLVENVFGTREGPGLYVDVGTSHPYHLSNTAFLDNCLGWRGVCLEPNPRLSNVIRGLRTCSVVEACAWANQTSMKFSNHMELATRTDKEELKPSRPGEMSDLHPSETFFEARCAPLHELLQEGLLQVLDAEELQAAASGHWKPRIDLLSVDAEGAELEIFKDFPFEAWDIRCIVVETSRRTSMAVDSLLLPLGFVKVAILGKDAVYLSHLQMTSFPSGGSLQLPEQIAWNAPGSEADTIEYRRFQRMFGLDADLDVDRGAFLGGCETKH
ncbi:HERC1 [Symbiodinium natans]|uniref:HERC1 protein n=1 Tax=Symbiodinium natans TaxID=878477 RepID=A0A812RNL4_9DINO|nr:HERC1 [Symbiodinium natans]